ncbi:hypothetical protein M5W75_21850, partial [Paenibacillus larvae]|uniref:hypothetical protein n=1 Tax=Paenibacillus larvae TaxID=1464 RepID=UPI0022827B4B
YMNAVNGWCIFVKKTVDSLRPEYISGLFFLKFPIQKFGGFADIYGNANQVQIALYAGSTRKWNQSISRRNYSHENQSQHCGVEHSPPTDQQHRSIR